MTDSSQQSDARPPLDVGWVLAGPMGPLDVEASIRALDAFKRALESGLPQFNWRVALAHRRELALDLPAEPMSLVDVGVLERDAAHWDFAFVITESPLRSESKPYMLGAPSQALDVAMLSTARLDPDSQLREPDRDQRLSLLSKRVTALALHLFGHLNDLPHRDDEQDYMHPPEQVDELDRMRSFSADGWARLRERLEEVADPRVEEGEHLGGRLGFPLEALWRNKSELVSGIKRIAPWQFPLRYSRLTTAAASTQLLLLITAEAWELGMSQPMARVAVLSAVAIAGTSYYILLRQHLLSRFGVRMTEQSVVTAAAVSMGVLLGMAITYVLLFVTTWLASKALFGPALVHNWTASLQRVQEQHYLSLAGFVASLGLLIGALGASFEQESYFRRVALLDEET